MPFLGGIHRAHRKLQGVPKNDPTCFCQNLIRQIPGFGIDENGIPGLQSYRQLTS